MKILQFVFILWIEFHSRVFCNPSSCLLTDNGNDYDGGLNITKSNRSCIPWKYGEEKFSLEDLKVKDFEQNVCRNPNQNSTIWCYVSAKEIEHCDLKVCPVNLQSKYCIPIPTAKLHKCPTLFERFNQSNATILEQLIFCCLKNEFDIKDLPIEDNCLVTVIENSYLKPNRSLCPSGYYSRYMGENILVNGTVYQCCRHRNVSQSSLEATVDFIIRQSSNSSFPVFASLTKGSCKSTREFYTEVIEFVSPIHVTQNMFSSLKKICFYFLNDSPRNSMNESQLGFLSSTLCPADFAESDEIFWNNAENYDKIRSCWPIAKSHTYPLGQYCLVIKKTNFFLKCPKDFHAYVIQSSTNGAEMVKFCCNSHSSSRTTIFWPITSSENVSVIFVKNTDECPFMMSNTSMMISTINISIDSLPSKVMANTFSKANNFASNIYLCNYEPLKDQFAYKKIGDICPPGMVESSIKFRSVLHWEPNSDQDIFTIEYCVGNTILKSDSFPKGKYCLFKIGKMCPIGFLPKSIPDTKHIMTSTGPVPDYADNAFCCRSDGDNHVIIYVNRFPYLDLENKVSFGILTSSKMEICPKIKDMIEEHMTDTDGNFCNYRTQQENYKWHNKIIFPNLLKKTNVTYPIRKSWASLTNFQYTSSVVLKYPQSQFCIVSSEKCATMSNIDFAILFPLADHFLCCSLDKYHQQYNYASLNNTKQYRVIGFVAMNGKCPAIDEHVYTLQNIIEDTYEIDRKDIDAKLLVDFISLGITPDVQTKLKYARVKFKFCMFELMDQYLSKEEISFRSSNGFLVPMQSSCPNGFIKKLNTLSLNLNVERNSISSYFVMGGFNTNSSYATFCFPKRAYDDYMRLVRLPELCTFNYYNCPTGTYAEKFQLIPKRNSLENSTPFLICCNTGSGTITHGLQSFTAPFSLPLRPKSKRCPRIPGFHHEIWKLNLLSQEHFQFIFLCLYYIKMLPTPWPSGTYLTVSYKQNCPPYFMSLKYNKSSICIRNQTESNQSFFPSGRYCLLSYTSVQCPLSGIWYSNDIIQYKGKSYILCCSKSTDMILNIHTHEYPLGFLSIDRCSIIPNTKVVTNPFFKRIVLCLYFRSCSYNSSNPCDGLPADSKVSTTSLLPTQMIIIICAIIYLFLLFGFVFIVIFCVKLKNHQTESQKDSVRLGTMYLKF